MNMKRKLIPALAMLLISATMLTSASFAWFSINTTVTATGMEVQARAEPGILISNQSTPDSGTWGASADSALSGNQLLYPASTSDTTTWYKSTSTSTSVHSGTDYTQISGSASSYYATNNFYIMSAGTALDVTNLTIKSVTAAAHTGGSKQDLHNSVRVAVKVDGDTNSKVYFFAPLNQGVGAYYVWNGSNLETDQITPSAGTAPVTVGITKIPAKGQSPIHVTVYVYFEGEDENCKSDNLINTAKSLDITLTFGYTPKAE